MTLIGQCVETPDVRLQDIVSIWGSEKQPTVSHLSAEAEYRSMAATIWELQRITFFMQDFKVPVQLPIALKCVSQDAIYISQNAVFHERTKHIKIYCHIVRDKYKDGFLRLFHVSSADQVADILTKSLV